MAVIAAIIWVMLLPLSEDTPARASFLLDETLRTGIFMG